MRDRIVNVVHEPIRAAAQFNYRGWVVSFSTIFNCKVAVFKNMDGDIAHECDTVQQAIDYIDNQS